MPSSTIAQTQTSRNGRSGQEPRCYEGEYLFRNVEVGASRRIILVPIMFGGAVDQRQANQTRRGMRSNFRGSFENMIAQVYIASY